jgi:hypothetical protein
MVVCRARGLSLTISTVYDQRSRAKAGILEVTYYVKTPIEQFLEHPRFLLLRLDPNPWAQIHPNEVSGITVPHYHFSTLEPRPHPLLRHTQSRLVQSQEGW